MIGAWRAMGKLKVDSDWYAKAFKPEMAEMTWAANTGREVDRVVKMLRLEGDERVLDMACGTGRHALEFARRGFDVTGVELAEPLLEVARAEAEEEGFDIPYIQGDLRDIEIGGEFDVVLNLNDGAIGYLETEEDNEKIFATAASALVSGGRQLMQLPNILHAKKHLPQKTWIGTDDSLEILEHHWNPDDMCLYGSMHLVREGETFSFDDRIVFRQRLYEIAEVDTIVRQFEMRVTNAYRGNGRARPPDDSQYEVFIEVTKA